MWDAWLTYNKLYNMWDALLGCNKLYSINIKINA